jgi:GTP pyrophosphokinase
MNRQRARGLAGRLGTAVRGGRDGACEEALAPVLAACAGVGPGDWPSVIRRAYMVSAYWHRGQLRRSGEPYVTHPVQVARILAEAGADPPTLCAALLHDVPADTGCPVALLREEFGSEVVGLVEGVTRLDGLDVAACQALAAGGGAPSAWDSRVLMVKLADRLHNMRTVSYLTPAKQQRKSLEVIEGFVPLARALGMPAMEHELAERARAVLAAADPGHGQVRPAGGGASRRVLALTALLLPGPARGRWLEEWTGELATLPSRPARARFALSMLAGMPALAVTLRGPSPARAGQP